MKMICNKKDKCENNNCYHIELHGLVEQCHNTATCSNAIGPCICIPVEDSTVICPIVDTCTKENKVICEHKVPHKFNGGDGCHTDYCTGEKIGPCIEYVEYKPLPKLPEPISPFQLEIIEVER